MTQWAEVRHLHLGEDVLKREIARRLKLDVKTTVRRAISQPTPPARVSPRRPSSLDPWRERITQWLREEPKVTAKRIRRLLLPLTGPVPARTVRRYVAGLRAAVAPKEAFVHRSVRATTTMEVDFGESWVDIAGVPRKVKYLVATLPFSNAYFAKAYAIERLESLLDGIESAFCYYGGVVDRVVLDSTSLAVKAVLAGRDRVETEAFEAFRGGYPGGAERGDHRGAGGGPADAAPRRRALGRGSAGAGAVASVGDVRSPAGHLPRRPAGGQQLRTRPRGPRDVLGADPARLPAGVGEAVSRPGGDRGRPRGGRRASPGVRPGREGPRCASRAAVAGVQAPGRSRGEGAPRLAAGPGVAAGAGRTRQAHAQARPGMGPDATADGDPPGPRPVCPPVTEMRPELARIAVPAPTLPAYDALVEGAR